MNINLREDETDAYVSFYLKYLEEVQQLNKKVMDVLNEVMQQAKYDKLQQMISKVTDAYTETIIGDIEKGTFVEWENSSGSLRSCLRTYRAGDAADAVCARIEGKMKELMFDTLKIEKADMVETANPLVSEYGFEEMEGVCKSAQSEIQSIKSEYLSQAAAKESDNDIYGTLSPLFAGISAKLEVFFEASLKGFVQLHEFVKEAAAKTQAGIEEAIAGNGGNRRTGDSGLAYGGMMGSGGAGNDPAINMIVSQNANSGNSDQYEELIKALREFKVDCSAPDLRQEYDEKIKKCMPNNNVQVSKSREEEKRYWRANRRTIGHATMFAILYWKNAKKRKAKCGFLNKDKERYIVKLSSNHAAECVDKLRQKVKEIEKICPKQCSSFLAIMNALGLSGSILSDSDVLNINLGRYRRKEVDSSWKDDVKKTNHGYWMSNYSDGSYYTRNCTKCVVAYEVRRRGYDVVAKRRERGDKLPFTNDPSGWPSAFEDVNGNTRNPDSINQNALDDAIDEIEIKMRNHGNGARAIVGIAQYDTWGNDCGGHVFIAEQIDGKTIFCDPQSGEWGEKNGFKFLSQLSEKIKHAQPPGSIRIEICMLRIDDMKITEKVLECCEG